MGRCGMGLHSDKKKNMIPGFVHSKIGYFFFFVVIISKAVYTKKARLTLAA